MVQFVCLAHVGTRWVAFIFDMARKQLTTFDADGTQHKSDNSWESHKEVAKSLLNGLKMCIAEFFTCWIGDWTNWTYVFLTCPSQDAVANEPCK